MAKSWVGGEMVWLVVDLNIGYFSHNHISLSSEIVAWKLHS